MPKFVIRSEGYVNGAPGGAEGKFLEWFDPYADKTGMMGSWTEDPARAKTFSSMIEAWTCWKHPRLDRHNVPYHRPDGQLDRPLTAFSVSVIPLSDVLPKGTEDGKQEEAADHPARSTEADAATDSQERLRRIFDELLDTAPGSHWGPSEDD